MRPTKLLLLALALGAAALVSLQLRRTDDATAETKTALVPTAVLDGARALTITLKPTGKAVTVEKGADGVWTVKEKHGLPADLENRLIPLFRALQKAENFGVLTANPKRIEKLNLDSALRLTAADGKVTELTFGKTTDDGLGAAATVAEPGAPPVRPPLGARIDDCCLAHPCRTHRGGRHGPSPPPGDAG